MDGTLVSFHLDISGSRQRLIDELGQRGFDTSRFSRGDWTQTILDEVRAQIKSGSVQAEYSEIRNAFYNVLDDYELLSIPKARVFDGVTGTLAWVKSEGVQTACLSNSGRRAVEWLLKKHGLARYFDFVLTRDETPTMKPRPEGILKAVEMFAVPTGTVLYVGDSLADIQAGHAAGVRVASIPTGTYALSKLKAGGSDYILRNMRDLKRLKFAVHMGDGRKPSW